MNANGGPCPGHIAVDARQARVDAIEATVVGACCIGSAHTGAFAKIPDVVACKQQVEVMRSR